ncbi:DUF768 domain-containing protein [Mesorhizobium sp. B2-7-3]|nr:DUF768 domain-containing protein [Mesorhizobium sp. B2-7-3]TPL67458.1 DUF768 domain-containing protein [Mesorhizobium sp. B2-3-15]TPL99492.1 DUF768 domain-containing protein [Mesorhizobium sp. B2-3-10]
MSTRGANFLDRWMAEHLPNGRSDRGERPRQRGDASGRARRHRPGGDHRRGRQRLRSHSAGDAAP